MEATRDGLWDWNVRTDEVYYSPGYIAMLGYSSGEVPGRASSWTDRIHPDDKDQAHKANMECVENRREHFEVEFRMRAKNGEWRWILGRGKAVARDENGRATRMIGTHTDITGRKQAEEALRESEARLRGTADSAQDAILMMDPQGAISYWNPAAEAIFGYRPEEAIGRDLHKLLVSEPYLEAFRAAFPEFLRSGRGHAIGKTRELAARRKDGAEIAVSLSLSALSLHGEWHAVGIVRDITERNRAEATVRESEEKHRALVSGLPDIVMRFDREGRHLFVSENASDVFGLPAAQFIGKTHRELGFPEIYCRHGEEAIRKVFESGAPFETELSFHGKNPWPAVFNRRLVPERDERGAVQSVLSISRDITAQRRLEQDYQTLFREMLDGFSLHEIIRDEQGKPVDYRFLAVNPAFERMTGLKAQDITGKTVREVLPGIEPHRIETYGKVALTGEPVFFEDCAKEAGRHFQVTAFRPAPDEFACILADITERKRAEEALQESEGRFRSIAEQSSDLIALTDAEGVIVYASPASMRLFHARPEEMTGCHFTRFLDESAIPAATAAFRDTMEHGRSVASLELKMRRKDGSTFVGEMAGSLCHSALRRGTLVTIRDITGRKRAEEEREELHARLAQAQKMESIGRLAGGVAHDFNNLLTVINGYSQVALAELGAGDPLRAKIAEIHKAGERAAGLTRQLMAFSRGQVLQPRVLDLNRVVGEMRPMLERLVGETVELRVALSAESGTVRADPHQLEQVIMNLAVNARDAMPGGGRLLIETASVELDESLARPLPEARAGRYVVLEVSDSGTGMDEETRQRIFEPFFTTKGAGQGTGLGLSMVQGIVVQSGGYIDVHSEPGLGTTFRIYLPALVEAAADAGEPAAVPAVGGKETVLVVEDQAEVRDYAVTVLKAYGYRVIQAESPGEALSICERERGRIHLVLTDVVMPVLSGHELAVRLEKMRPGIKVLFMSGYTGEFVMRHGVLEQDVAFIQKPFSPQALAAKVRAVLGPPGPAARILVADDEAGVRGFLRAALEMGGYEVIEAADGNQALRLARVGRVDLVITDLIMPDKEGIETIQALRKELPGIAIIAISGAFGGRYLKAAQRLGANAALGKPIRAELLLATVAAVLNSGTTKEDASAAE